MKNKKGISLIAITSVLVIILILISTISISVVQTLNHSKKVKIATELSYLQEMVKGYELANNGALPMKGSVIIDVSKVSSKAMTQFAGEKIENGKIVMQELDKTKIGVQDTAYGNNKDNEDIYVISETTGKIYYAKGEKIGDNTFYTLEDELKEIIKYDASQGENTEEGMVVFEASTKEWTNVAISVKTKVKDVAENVVVTVKEANGNKRILSKEGNEGEYLVYTTNGIEGNYVVEVAYTKKGESSVREAKYEVTNYDAQSPEIDAQNVQAIKNSETKEVYSYVKINKVTDNLSGIKIIKYETEKIQEGRVKEYFRTNGTEVKEIGTQIPNNGEVTIYVEDKAGNYAVRYITNENKEEEGTRILDEVTPDKPYIPEDFEHTEGTVEEGYVIKDKYGNEYVWVPVYDTTAFQNIEYNRGIEISKITEPGEEEKAEYTKMLNGILRYGGYYVGRYEASNNNSKVGSKKNQSLWKENYASAKAHAGKVVSDYGYKNMRSTLMYGIEYDRILERAKEEGKNVADSRSWGNYNTESITGSKEEYITKNIYDIAGNAVEWTNEKTASGRIGRGGNNAAAYREEKAVNTTSGYRVALYLEKDQSTVTAPEIVATPSGWTNGNVEVRITGNGNVSYSTDKQIWTNYTGALTITKNQTIYARNVDATGQRSEIVEKKITNIDKDKPIVSVEPNGGSYKGGSTGASLEVTLKGTDSLSGIKTLEYAWNTSSQTAPTSGWTSFTNGEKITKNGLLAGNHYVWIRGVDNAGNEIKQASKAFTIVMDTKGPVMSHTLNVPETTKTYPVVITVKATDESGVKYIELPDGTQVAGNGALEQTTTLTVTKNGEYTFKSEDMNGNKTEYIVTITNILEFITEYTIPADNTQITLPIEKENPDIYVDWGDGTKENVNTLTPSHTYARAGIYDVKITGYLPNYGSYAHQSTEPEIYQTKQYLTEIKQWGILGIKSMQYAFQGCGNLAGSIPEPHIRSFEKVTSFADTFKDCKKLTGSIPEALFAGAINVTTFKSTFENCSKLTGNILESLFANNTKVTTFSSTFSGCSGLIGNIPQNLFMNNSEVTSFYSTFVNCKGLTGPIPENLFANNIKAITFNDTFMYCGKLTGSIPENLFANNDEVIEFSRTFYGCSSLTGSIPENLFANNLKVENFSSTFANCSGLTGNIPEKLFVNNIKANNFGNGRFTDTATYIGGTFYGCSGLTGTIPEKLFANCPEAKLFDTTFAECTRLSGNIPKNLFKNNPKATSFNATFLNMDNIIEIPENLFANNPLAESFNGTFAKCDNLQIVPKEIFKNKQNVKNVSYLFYDSAKVSGELKFYVDNIDNITSAFEKTSTLATTPLTLYYTDSNLELVKNIWNTKSEDSNIELYDEITAPTITGVLSGTNATLTIEGSTSNLGIKQYEYSIDNGATWTTYNASSKPVVDLNVTKKVQARAENIYGRKGAIGIYAAPDLTGPVMSHTLDVPESTKTYPVTITIKATDESGVKYIELPDGTQVAGNGALEQTTTLTVTKNGEYTFKSEDMNGNKTEYIVTITNILEFITEYTIPADNTEIVLPIEREKPDIYIDWGDGTKENVNTLTPSHTYARAGVYDVKITGYLPRYGVEVSSYSTDENAKKLYQTKQYLTKIKQWGILGTKSMQYAFQECNNLSGSIPEPNPRSFEDVTTFRSTFHSCSNLTGSIPENLFKNSLKVTDFTQVFRYCENLTGSIPETLFENNTLVTRFWGSFDGCQKITSIPENLFKNNINVTDFGLIFRGCLSITEIPENLFKYNVKVTSFNRAFHWCEKLTNIPENLFKYNILAEDFSEAFKSCYDLKSIPENLFYNNTEAIDFGGTFNGCKSITTIPEKLFWNNPKVRYFGGKAEIDDKYISYSDGGTFSDCEKITSIPEKLFYYNPEVESFSMIFSDTSITTIPENLFKNNTKVTDFSGAFLRTQALITIPEKLFEYNTLAENFNATFRGTYYLKNIPRDLLKNNPAITNISYMFNQARNLVGEFVIYADNIANYEGMFKNASISTLASTPLTLYYTDSNLELVKNIWNTKSEDSNIELYDEITAPTITGALSGMNATLTIEGSTSNLGIKQYEYSIDNGTTWTTYNVNNKPVVDLNVIKQVQARAENIYGRKGAIGIYAAPDKTGPVITHTLNIQAPQQGYPIIISLKATDESGISEVILPDGTKVAGNGQDTVNTTYTVTKNGEYLFSATDLNGNKTEYTVEVTNVLAFITEYTIPADNTEIVLPIKKENPDIYVDWGDGTKENINTLTPSHTYAKAGVYDVKITGYLPNYGMNVNENSTGEIQKKLFQTKQYLTRIKQWGILGTSIMDSAFENCYNLLGEIPEPHIRSFENVTEFASTFEGCNNLTGSIPENLFAGAVKANNLDSIFYGCNNLTGSIPENLFAKTTKVTSFHNAFNGCENLTGSIPEKLFANNPLVTSFFGTFRGCENLTGSIPEKLFWNTKNVTDFASTFNGCKQLTGIPENLFSKCTQVIRFTFTFNGCHSIPEIPENLFKYNILANDFSETFNSCKSITSIPEKLFYNNTEAIDFGGTFKTCKSIISIPEKLFWNNTKVTNFSSTFSFCSSLTGSIPENLFANNTKVTNFDSTFSFCSSLTGNIPENLFANCPEVTNFSATFLNCSKLTGSIPEKLFANNTKVTRFGGGGRYDGYYALMVTGTFSQCSGLTGSIPENLFANCPEVTSFGDTFHNCSNLSTEIPENLFKYNTKVTNFSTTFMKTSIKRIPEGLFANCPLASNFNATFLNCSKLENVPKNLFKNNKNIDDIRYLFSGTLLLSGELKFEQNNINQIKGAFEKASTSATTPLTLYYTDSNLELVKNIWNTRSENSNIELYDEITAPTITGALSGNNATLTIEGSSSNLGIKQYEYSLDNGATWTTYNASSKPVIDINVTKKVHARAENIYGRKGAIGMYAVPDKTGPVITHTLNIQAPQQGYPIIISLKATDESGISEVILPDGTKVAGNGQDTVNTTYTVTKNGEYLFSATDLNGNKTEYTVEVTNVLAFITEYTIPADNTEITLPIQAYDPDVYIDWGDGTKENSTIVYPSHIYTKAGIYEVKITGYLPNYGTERAFGELEKKVSQTKLYLTGIKQWGILETYYMKDAFKDCKNLIGSIPEPDIRSFEKVINFSYVFANCVSLETNIPETLFQGATKVTTFNRAFYNCFKLNGNISEKLFINNPEVDNFSYLFYNCSKLTGNIPESLFAKNPNVFWVTSLFYNCSNLTGSIPGNLFAKNPNVANFANTFDGCRSLTGSIPENLFQNNTKVTTFYMTFANCTGLTGSIPERLFANNPLVTDFSYVFFLCKGLTGSIPENLFKNNINVTELSSAFNYCIGLTGSIPERLFANNPEVVDIGYIFADCSGLTGSISENLFVNNTKLKNANRIFYECRGLTGTIPANLLKNNVELENLEAFFSNCRGLTGSIPENLFQNNTKLKDMSAVFYSCFNLTGTIPEKLLSSCTLLEDVAAMFYGDSGLTGSIPESLFINNPNLKIVGRDNTIAVVHNNGIFENCSGLNVEIPEKLFANNPKITNFSSVFSGMKITTIPENLFANNTMATEFIATFEGTLMTEIPSNLFANNKEVTSFYKTFKGCYRLKQIPENLFANNPKVEDFTATFYACPNLESIPSKLFVNNSAVKYFGKAQLSWKALNNGTFEGCTKLTSIPSTLFDKCTNVTSFHKTFKGCTSITSVAPDLWNKTKWPNVTDSTECFTGSTNISNYSSIPTGWI